MKPVIDWRCNRKQIFFSHSGPDVLLKEQEVNRLQPDLNKFVEGIESRAEVFISSDPKRGLGSGDDLLLEIKKHLGKSDMFLVFITDNFLRSPYCIYELYLIKSFYRGKEVHYFYANETIENKMRVLGDSEKVYHVLSKGVGDIINSILAKKSLLCTLLKDEKTQRNFAAFLKFMAGEDPKYPHTPCIKPYIGQSAEERKDINGYVERVGIKRIASSGLYTKEELKNRMVNSDEVFCVATTGASLLKILKEDILPQALRNEKFVFHMILPARDSDFCNEVAEVECKKCGNVVVDQNKRRIFNEYEATIQYLNEAYLLAVEQNQDKNKALGKILLHNSHTLLRQTILLTKSADTIWGWLSITMPPSRTVANTGILFECKNTSKDGEEKGKEMIDGEDKDKNETFGMAVLNHCKSFLEYEKEGYEINGYTEVQDIESAMENRNELRLKDVSINMAYWRSLYHEAQAANPAGPTLIEIAAQHPLENGITPGIEFTARLDEAVRIYRQLKMENNQQVVKMFVPGSIHCENGRCDTIELSQAGIEYLKNKLSEIEFGDVLSNDETNKKYMGEDGVYNLEDECYVATQVYYNICKITRCESGQIICVCSPNQVMRKTFVYLKYGIEVMCHSVPVPGKKMYHNPIDEYFYSLRRIVYQADDWQDKDNDVFQQSRKKRRPE